MGATLQPPCAYSDACVDELIDVARIRLRNCGNATALLSDFRSADRVLACWASDAAGALVDYEVTFSDGCVIRGCCAFSRKRRAKRSLCAHVRDVMGAAAAGPDQSAEKRVARYLVAL